MGNEADVILQQHNLNSFFQRLAFNFCNSYSVFKIEKLFVTQRNVNRGHVKVSRSKCIDFALKF